MPTIGKKLIENGTMANEKVLWLEMVNALEDVLLASYWMLKDITCCFVFLLTFFLISKHSCFGYRIEYR